MRGLDFGVEFTGGRLRVLHHRTPLSVDDGARRPSPTPASRGRSCRSRGDDNISVRAGQISNDEDGRIEHGAGEAGAARSPSNATS